MTFQKNCLTDGEINGQKYNWDDVIAVYIKTGNMSFFNVTDLVLEIDVALCWIQNCPKHQCDNDFGNKS